MVIFHKLNQLLTISRKLLAEVRVFFFLHSLLNSEEIWEHFKWDFRFFVYLDLTPTPSQNQFAWLQSGELHMTMGMNSASIPLDTRNHNQDEVEVMSTDSSSSSSSDSQWSNSHTISSSIIIKRIPSINK